MGGLIKGELGHTGLTFDQIAGWTIPQLKVALHGGKGFTRSHRSMTELKRSRSS